MLDNPIALLGLSTLLAAIPIAVWLFITLKQGPSSKKIALMVFGLGCITAPALLGLQVVWEGRTALIMALIPISGLAMFIFDSYLKKAFAALVLILCIISNYMENFQWLWSIKIPQFNLQSAIETNASSYFTATVLSLLLFVILEENIKLYVMRTIDRKTLYISKINDAMIYAIAAALGFSFAENVYYLYSFWPSVSNSELITMYIFRGIFTTAAHMTYSGIFGYYYGIGKFSMVINQQNLIEGTQDKISLFIAKIFNIPPSEGFRQKTVLKGLMIAMGLHFSINFMLQLQQDYGIRILFPIVILCNIAMFAFLQYLMSRKAGHLILLSDPSTKKSSTMVKKDEEVVIELMNMWLKDQRYVDVIHICERLLERDPDNNVVKMFKAKAMDEMDEKNIYKKILGTVVKTDDELSTDDKSIINKYTATKDSKKTEPQEIQNQPQPQQKKDILEKLTGEGTFKL
ncbi:MAG: PrsW family glutamic-type intramembrane protease [Candidatus Peregrinibacteria bacterium]|nr:PrsW family glutamic-type intramembrane protease [Candidatus Peregrinibacteria bacterium]